MNDDNQLRSLFEAIRREEESLAPSFDALLARPRRRPRAARRVLAFAAVVLIAVIALVALRERRPAPLPVEQLTQWRSPTASLLVRSTVQVR